MGTAVPTGWQSSYELFAILGILTAIWASFSICIMPQHRESRKEVKAEGAFIVRLEHSISPDAEARLQQAYSIVLRAAGTAESEDGCSDQIHRDMDNPKEESEQEHHPGDR